MSSTRRAHRVRPERNGIARADNRTIIVFNRGGYIQSFLDVTVTITADVDPEFSARPADALRDRRCPVTGNRGITARYRVFLSLSAVARDVVT